MKFTKFEITKFKGIKHLLLDLSKIPQGNIFPLVGLNESGKTTVLEAINLFQNGVKDGQEHELIHKASQGVFSGSIKIKATLELNKIDKEFIRSYLEKEKFELEEDPGEILITKEYQFENSVFIKLQPVWIIQLSVKKRQAKNFVKLHIKDIVLWNKLTEDIEINHIPKILYFPDFLFKFPERIWLENIQTLSISENDKDVLEEYRRVIDDLLRSIDESYNLNDFLTKLKAVGDSAKQAAAIKIKNDIVTTLNKRIIEPWSSIFPGPKKDIIIDTGIENTGAYLEIKVREGGNPFCIHERSLGFKWFFGFILFTEFRKMREGENGEYLFLLDEPASNLHQSSQIKLLDIFRNLADGAKIIYSTHSHYLLNIDFLSNALIVKDEGRNAEGEDSYCQDIKAIPYRKFIATHETDDETHIKPILDILEYIESPLLPLSKLVFFEGKNDYYTFKWVRDTFFPDKGYDFNFFPGAGVDKCEPLFKEYLANSRKFIAIFDDDGDDNNGGKGAQKRYFENISQELERNIFTLSAVKVGFVGFRTENLFLLSSATNEKLDIQKTSYQNDSTYNKKHFNKAIENLLITKSSFPLKKSTLNKFEAIFEFMQDKLNELD